MHMNRSTPDRPEATDALFDASPAHLLAVFTRRMHEQIGTGKDPRVAAGLAFHFAWQILDARPKIIGTITPAEPWGVNR